jgi:hypothetical protein
MRNPVGRAQPRSTSGAMWENYDKFLLTSWLHVDAAIIVSVKTQGNSAINWRLMPCLQFFHRHGFGSTDWRYSFARSRIRAQHLRIGRVRL